VHRGHKSSSARQPVLAAAQLPSVDVPPPDVDIDSEYQADEDQQTWADNGIKEAESVELTSPQEDGLQPTEANLLHESDSVVATEDKLLLDEYTLELSADKDLDAHICDVLGYALILTRAANFNPNDPSQVADDIESLKPSDGPYATNVVGDGITSAFDLMQQAFPQCNNTLDTIQWIIEQFQKLFCPTG
jgi:hypothetical protein